MLGEGDHERFCKVHLLYRIEGALIGREGKSCWKGDVFQFGVLLCDGWVGARRLQWQFEIRSARPSLNGSQEVCT